MRALHLLVLLLIPGSVLPAEDALSPKLHLTPEAATAAAWRIDAVAMAMEQAKWTMRMRTTPADRQTPLAIPPQVDDATFIRRVSLDLQARLPAPQEVREFLSDTDPERRERLVDRLLLDPASAARRFTQLADMLRVKDEVLGVSQKPYVDWLRDACAKSMPYDQLVRTLLTASGDMATNPATGWVLGDAGHMTVTSTETLRVFLDEDISCARCHDHPFNPWTQKQFYEFAACFNGAQVVRMGPQGRTQLWPAESWSEENRRPLEAGETLSISDARSGDAVRLPARYYYKDGKSGDPVRPRLLAWQGAELTNGNMLTRVKEEKLREAFADWIVTSRRFPMVAAMRAWHEFFGSPGRSGYQEAQGAYDTGTSRDERIRTSSCEAAPHFGMPGYSLVGDLLDRSNGTTPRRFLEALSQELLWVRYDMREFERILCRTEAYQRESVVEELGHPVQVLAPVMRPLPPETVWNNLMRVQTDDAPRGDAPLSHELPQVLAQDHPARILGRGGREWGDESQQSFSHRMVRLMMNGEPAQSASASEGALVRRLGGMPSADAAVQEAFLSVLGRLPSPGEKRKAMDYGIANPTTVWSDLVWSLLNTGEFLFQR